MGNEYPIFVGGKFKTTPQKLVVTAPFYGAEVGATYLAGEAEIDEAAQAAADSFEITKKLAPFERASILEKISGEIDARKEEIANVLAQEAGKPIAAARIELERSVFTFRYAAEESKRIHGEIIPLDVHPLAAGRASYVKRFPIGPVLGISPFNFPLNLVAHKVAPAIAAGCPIVIKPASQTPLTALMLAEIVNDSGWPQGAFSVVPCKPALAEKMAKDERFKLLTFTGSPVVGWHLKGIAGKKKVALELGGNAGVIVHSDADLEYAATRIALGGFGYSGQTCISVQRVLVHQPVYEKFKAIFIEKVKALKTGDPLDESTDVGPVISKGDMERLNEWVDEAVRGGAKIICGGGSEGAVSEGAVSEGSIMQPTVLESATPEMKVNCLEVFGPIVTVAPYEDIYQAIGQIDASEYGLQAGLFTNDLKAAFAAWERLEVGGVIIGDVPTFRIDHMPYGGVKSSGLGREGIKYAIEEMTELRNLVINLL